MTAVAMISKFWWLWNCCKPPAPSSKMLASSSRWRTQESGWHHQVEGNSQVASAASFRSGTLTELGQSSFHVDLRRRRRRFSHDRGVASRSCHRYEISHHTSFQHLDISCRVSSCLFVVFTQSAARSQAETMAQMTCEFHVVAVMFAK